MQQGRLVYSSSFSLRESAPYFYLVLGRGWQIPNHRPDDNNVKKSLDTITLDPALPLFRREHYPFEKATSQQTAPWVSIDDARVAENLKTLSVSVTLSHPSDQVVSVKYATGPWTGPNPADKDKDYTMTASTLIWKPGEPLTKTLTVPILDDTRDEYDEAFQVSLSAPTNAAMGRGTAVCTILDDDVAPSLSVQDVSLAEHLKSMTVTVTLSAASDKQVTVKYATANDTGDHKAEAGKDYTATAGTLTWKPGESLTKTITVPILDDNRDEYDEIFQLQLSAPANGEISRGTAVGTILDNDAAPSLSVQGASLAEHLKSMTVTVTLSAGSDKQVTVKYATANGTGDHKAEAGKDYTATAGTLTWKPGESLTKTITVPILDDKRDEYDEIFQLQLSAPANGEISRGTAVGTILDNDAAPSLSVQGASLAEHLKSMTVTVTLSAASDKQVTVKYATANGTGDHKAEAGKDYTATAGTLTWKPGESLTKTITVPILDDKRDEYDEIFQLQLSAPANAEISRGTAVGTILDNDAAPSLSVQGASLAEHLKSMTVTVTLSAASDKQVTVKYATANGTGAGKAEAGKDYTARSGTLTWKPGEPLTKSFTVPILDDSRDERNETFQVNLSAPTNADIGQATAVCTILDNDRSGTKTSTSNTTSSSNLVVMPVAMQPVASQLPVGKQTRPAAISGAELAPVVPVRARDQGLSGVDSWRFAELDLSWAGVESQSADESPEKDRLWSSALLDDLANGVFASTLLRRE